METHHGSYDCALFLVTGLESFLVNEIYLDFLLHANASFNPAQVAKLHLFLIERDLNFITIL